MSFFIEKENQVSKINDCKFSDFASVSAFQWGYSKNDSELNLAICSCFFIFAT